MYSQIKTSIKNITSKYTVALLITQYYVHKQQLFFLKRHHILIFTFKFGFSVILKWEPSMKLVYSLMVQVGPAKKPKTPTT